MDEDLDNIIGFLNENKQDELLSLDHDSVPTKPDVSNQAIPEITI